MMAKIVQGCSFGGAGKYILEKQDARLLNGKGVRLKDHESIIKSFITQSKMKPNIKKPVAHISLNFSVQDKSLLTDKFMINIAEEYLEKMGYENTQYIIVRHCDTEHPHLHLMINRIDNKGKRISDKNEKLRNTKVCMKLTKKYGLYIASGKEKVNRHRLREPCKTKYEIYEILQTVIPKCKNWQELKTELMKSGIGIEFKTNGNTSKIQGIRFAKNGYVFNGSKVDRAFSYSKINYQFLQKEMSMHIQSHSDQRNKASISTAQASMKTLLHSLNSPSKQDEYQSKRLRPKVRKRKNKKSSLRL